MAVAFFSRRRSNLLTSRRAFGSARAHAVPEDHKQSDTNLCVSYTQEQVGKCPKLLYKVSSQTSAALLYQSHLHRELPEKLGQHPLLFLCKLLQPRRLAPQPTLDAPRLSHGLYIAAGV